MKYKNKHILILGASGGIGSALTQRLLKQGANVILHSHGAIDGVTNHNNQKVLTICADLTCSEGIEILINTLKKNSVTLSGVIFAAGMNDFKLLVDQNDENISKMMTLNALMPMFITKRILTMVDSQTPIFLAYVGSTMGSIGLPGSTTYCASKFALRGFVQALRRELGDTKISCLYIAPRATKTSMNNQAVVKLNEALGYKMDEPSFVAEQIIKAISKGHEVTYIGWPERFLVRLNAIFPQILDKFLLKQLSIFKKYAN